MRLPCRPGDTVSPVAQPHSPRTLSCFASWTLLSPGPTPFQLSLWVTQADSRVPAPLFLCTHFAGRPVIWVHPGTTSIALIFRLCLVFLQACPT